MPRRTPWICFALFLLACTAKSVPYTIVDRGVHTGKQSPSPSFAVITDEERFGALFRAMHADQLPPPAPPAVDFEQSLVLVVTMGTQPTTGYSVSIERIDRYQDILRVTVHFQHPPPEARYATMITHPFVLAQVPKSPQVQRVEFVDQDATVLSSLQLPNSSTQ